MIEKYIHGQGRNYIYDRSEVLSELKCIAKKEIILLKEMKRLWYTSAKMFLLQTGRKRSNSYN